MTAAGRRITSERAVGSRGFTRWVFPVMRRYLMACCDCGLVHEMEFTAVRVNRTYASGAFTAKKLSTTAYRVAFRARRAERRTQAQRARKRIEVRALARGEG